jgi:hypothetical protein
MKLMTTHELHACSDSELAALFHTVWLALVRTARGSAERRNALASLENITQVRSLRRYGYRL